MDEAIKTIVVNIAVIREILYCYIKENSELSDADVEEIFSTVEKEKRELYDISYEKLTSTLKKGE